MDQVLKGNFTTRKPVQVDSTAEENIEERFERQALGKLGGSIVFVSKKKVLWPEDDT